MENWEMPPEPDGVQESQTDVFETPEEEPDTVVSTEVKSSKFPKPKVAAYGGFGSILFQFFDFLQDVGITIVQSGRELLVLVAGAVVSWFAPDEWTDKIKKIWE